MPESIRRDAVSEKWNAITGATGLLGSHVAEHLIERGEKVRALVRPSSDVRFLQQLGVELAMGDLADPASLRRALEGAGIVYHCAARVGDWASWRSFQVEVIDATRTLLDACTAARVGRLLHVSSVAVYGHPRERADNFTEDEPLGQHLRFREFYIQSKIAAEELVRRSAVPWTIIRPTVIYGERDRNLLPRVIGALQSGWMGLVGTCEQKVNIRYAGDVAEAAILAANHPAAARRAYNVTSEGEITQRELCNLFADFLGMKRITSTTPFFLAFLFACWSEMVAGVLGMKRAPWVTRYGLALVERSCRYSTAKARTQLGWRPQISAVDGIRRTLQWYGEAVLGRKDTVAPAGVER
jgi:2-alkyl-3-oxoalkanoate reductase